MIKPHFLFGGKPIASGGYGCVFNPVLKCNELNNNDNNNNNNDNNNVSKLMYSKYAISEYNQIQILKHILNKIPNYQNYFIIDNITLCTPTKLQKKDLLKFNSVCSSFYEHNITEENVNVFLNKLLILNIPYAGISLDNWLRKTQTENNFKDCNIKLHNLLLHAILPMNKHNIYHCDIKESNLLIKEDKNNAGGKKINNNFIHIIDWGISIIYDFSIEQLIPPAFHNKLLQYNAPFSIIILNEYFLQKYSDYLNNPNKISLHKFVEQYVTIYNHEYGEGHFHAIVSFSEIFMKQKNKQKQQEKVMSIIVNYIVSIIKKFHFSGINQYKGLFEYFNNVFIKNIDVYGFIWCYKTIAEFYYINKNILTSLQKNIYKLLKYLFMKFVFNPTTKPYNISHLSNTLNKLNKLFYLETTKKKINIKKHLLQNLIKQYRKL
jgi:hypothetical protein